jgi:hypothetical protein
MRHRRRSPRQACELTDTANFGYGPTEEYPCGSPATHKAKAASWGGGHERVRMCTHHAKLWPLYSNDADKPAYRYRRVDAS